MSTEDAPVQVGDLVAGKYRVDAVLGAGAMGVVVAATHVDLQEVRAIKLLRASLSGDAATVERFLREARAAVRLRSEHVCRIHDVGRLDGGAPYIVMERLQGTDLKALLDARGSLPMPEAARYLTQVCEALAEAHALGIVHRDLKPANLFLTAGPGGAPCVKILDFGIAKVVSPPGSSGEMTETTALLGTPLYMSPEQMRGARDVDARSDIWALGVVLYRMLTGRTPFAGSSVTEICAAVVGDAPEPPALLRPDLPPALEAVVLRCLEKIPARRFAGAAELAAALAPFLDPAGVEKTAPPTATPPPQPEPGQAAGGGTIVMAPSASAATSGRRRAPLLLAAGAALALAAGMLASRWAGPGGSPPAPSTSASAGPIPTTITGLPRPATTSAAAAAAYQAGLQALRDGNWDAAGERFDRATALDPEMGEALVQRVVTGRSSTVQNTTALRRVFQAAWELRGRLSPRDLVLLEAYEPYVMREPRDMRAYAERLSQAAQGFPGDAQIALLAAGEIREPERALMALDHVLALDPRSADAWQERGARLAELGKVDEALAALDRCLEIAPGADCLDDRIGLSAQRGECAKMEADARQRIAKSAGGPSSYFLLALALGRDGSSDEAVLEAARQLATRLPPEERTLQQRLLPARLDVLRGRFERAEEQARALAKEVDASPEAKPHAAAARLLLDLLIEAGRPRDAARVAGEFLARNGAWNQNDRFDDPVPAMLDARVRAGATTRADALSRTDAWLATKRRSASLLVLPFGWAYAYAATVATPEEAEAALARQDVPLPPTDHEIQMWPARAHVGHALSLAGRTDAIPVLRQAAGHCAALVEPFTHTRAHAWLGEALEAGGDRAGACAAYAVVLARWGAAKPASVTAERARSRSAALGCAAPRGDGSSTVPAAAGH